MSLRVAVAIFVLLALAAFTVNAAIDERDRARAQSGPETLPATDDVLLWPDQDPLDCPVYPLVIREYEHEVDIALPAELPEYSTSALTVGSGGCGSCCIVLPDSTEPCEPLMEEEWI